MLSAENIVGVYIDNICSRRITVFGYPNSSRVYYTVEKFNADFSLECVYTSEAFDYIEDMDPLEEILYPLTDITDRVLH